MPFDGNPILARVCLLSCLPFSWGKDWLPSWGWHLPSVLQKEAEDFYSPKLFFYITALLFGDSLSSSTMHLALSGLEASLLCSLLCSPLLSSVGLVFLAQKECVLTGHHFVVFSVLKLFCFQLFRS